MESKFTLIATDSQAQHFFDNYHVKLMEFKGNVENYPEMDMNSPVIHPWRVLLRHRDEIGKLYGIYSYNRIVKILS